MSSPNWIQLAIDLGVRIGREEVELAGKPCVVAFRLEYHGRFLRQPSGATLEAQAEALNEGAKKLLTHIYRLSEL